MGGVKDVLLRLLVLQLVLYAWPLQNIYIYICVCVCVGVVQKYKKEVKRWEAYVSVTCTWLPRCPHRSILNLQLGVIKVSAPFAFRFACHLRGACVGLPFGLSGVAVP